MLSVLCANESIVHFDNPTTNSYYKQNKGVVGEPVTL